MTYRIEGLKRADFAPLFDMNDAELAQHAARRVIAAADRGWPCRVTLEDAKAGESLILVNHVSHDVDTPFRASHAIYVRNNAQDVADYIDAIPPVFEGRSLSLRGFDAEGMLRGAVLASPREADAKIRELFESDYIAYIHAHNAAYGCFAAKVERV